MHHTLMPLADVLIAVRPHVLAPAVPLIVAVHALMPVAFSEDLGAVPIAEWNTRYDSNGTRWTGEQIKGEMRGK